MREKFLENKWEYEIKKIQKKYGFRVDIFKNDSLVKSLGGFGSVNMAKIYARDYFLLEEFNVEKAYEV